jgi:acetyl esterase/lipase
MPRNRAVNGATFISVPYVVGGNARHVLDVRYPRTGTVPAGGWPAVLFIHGGGWWNGDKADVLTHEAIDCLNNGIALIVPNYRLSTTDAYPAHIYDVKAALRWMRANARRWRINPARIGAWGASAGAHLAAILALTPGVASVTDASLGSVGQSESLSCLVSWYAPTQAKNCDADFTAQALLPSGEPNGRGFAVCSTSSQEARLLGSDAAPVNPCSASDVVRDLADVVYWCANATDLPPMRIQHGEKLDGVVPVGQAQRFKAGMEARGKTFAADTPYHYSEEVGAGHGNAPWAALGAAAITWLTNNL